MPRRSRRAVYDPTIENDQLMKTTLFRDDPLASCDLEDDIRQWNNASSASSTPSKRKWCYVLTAVTTIVLLVIVGVSVRNSSSSNSNSNTENTGSSNNNAAPAAAPPTSSAVPMLDPPIPTLAQLCSRDRVERADLRTLCETECAKAACCALDCDSGANVAICQAYENICEILLVTEVKPSEPGLPIPPPELAQVCLLEQLTTTSGYQKCQAMCQRAECCHLPMSDPTSCSVPYHTQCIAYHSFCGILDHVSAPTENEGPKELGMPSEQLALLCAMDQLQTREGYQACHAACAPSSCCTATRESMQNCFAEYASVCDEYAGPCGALTRVVPPSPDDLPALCGVDQLQTVAGYEQCEAVCAQSSCCRPDEGIPASCATDELCLEYQGPCSILQTAVKPSSSETPVAANDGVSANRMHPPPSYITEQCTLENIQSSAEGRQRCADICAVADCCQFPSNLPELSCLAGNEDVCADYFSYCALLEGPSNGETNPSQWSNEYAGTDIYTACADLTTPYGLQTCHDVCTEARCCYTTGTGSCIDDQRCDDFDMCFNYKALAFMHEDIPDLIRSNCVDLVSLEGLELCEASCEQAVCCFTTTEDDNMLDCEGHDLSYCTQYAACQALMDLSLDDPNQSPALIQQNCADLVSLEGIQMCEASCERAVCCFTNDNTIDCDGKDLSFCSTYEACEELFDLVIDDPDRIPDLIQRDCADLVSLEGLELCEASCKPAMCCFAKDNTADCEGERLSYCGQYTACEALVRLNLSEGDGENGGNDIITVPGGEPISTREQVEVACGSANMDYEKCLTVCDMGRCCWNIDETSCSSGIDCSTYAACSILA